MKVPSKERLFDIVRPQLDVIEARAKALEPPAPHHADILANKIVAELHHRLIEESEMALDMSMIIQLIDCYEKCDKQQSLTPFEDLIRKWFTVPISNADMEWAKAKLASLGITGI